MCTLFYTEKGFLPGLNGLTSKLTMMKSCLAIFWMDLSATNAFFSAVEIILLSLDLRLDKELTVKSLVIVHRPPKTSWVCNPQIFRNKHKKAGVGNVVWDFQLFTIFWPTFLTVTGGVGRVSH